MPTAATSTLPGRAQGHYDPANLFELNQNIQPSQPAAELALT
jgi:hypothetical protein